MSNSSVNQYSHIDPSAVVATEEFTKIWEKLNDKSFWPIKIFVATNLFLWHLNAFAREDDPIPLFIEAFNKYTKLLKVSEDTEIMINKFSTVSKFELNNDNFENHVSGLFSDVWVEMTDEIYFDQTYNFTKKRLEKNNIDPLKFFKDKLVLDAGCGSGKFSTTIAKMGAKKVIGLDIGEKGLEFARKKAEETEYGNRIIYKNGSLLNIPLNDDSVDLIWSNGVVHHTLNYEKCISEFNRILKKDGELFLYVNGRFGLFELLQTTLRNLMIEIPNQLTQQFLILSGNNTGRVYWLMDCLYAPYEWKSKEEVVSILEKNNFHDILQLKRGIETDQIEMISSGLAYANVKYGEGQLKFICKTV